MIKTNHEEQAAGYYDKIYATGYNTSRFYSLYQEVIGMLETVEKPNVLELGCGVGDLARLIIERGHTYRGFDFSEEAVKQSQSFCSDGKFFVGNVYNAEDFKPADYNIVIALEVLEHVDDLKVMANLPPDVQLIASVPDYDDVAHLRLYQDPQRDIVDRYKDYLKITEIKTIVNPNPVSGDQMTIYLFHGTRISS
ncbi:MAG: class I SAM-dependent methyltransferase [candidate division Zixibacteria bacterium]